MASRPQSASATMRAWVRERLAQNETVVVKEMATEMFLHYKNDKAFLENLAEETMHGVITGIVREVLSATRRTSGMLMIGGKVMPLEAVGTQVARNLEKFQQRTMFHMEHVGDRHIRLGKMTKFDLLTAANERMARAETDVKVATVWRRMAERLNDNQTVEEVFQPEEIAKFLSEYKVELTIEDAA